MAAPLVKGGQHAQIAHLTGAGRRRGQQEREEQGGDTHEWSPIDRFGDPSIGQNESSTCQMNVVAWRSTCSQTRRAISSLPRTCGMLARFAAMPGARVMLGTEFAGVEQRGDGVVVRARRGDGGEVERLLVVVVGEPEPGAEHEALRRGRRGRRGGGGVGTGASGFGRHLSP